MPTNLVKNVVGEFTSQTTHIVPDDYFLLLVAGGAVARVD